MKKILSLLALITSLHLSSQSVNELYSGDPILRGAKVIGNRPNTPIIHTIAATGERPIRFDVDGLPEGVDVDPNTGIMTGVTKDTGTYNIKVTAINNYGKKVDYIKLVVGNDLCLTPALGWNSWNVFTSNISEKMLMEIADAMVKNGMRDLGYEYINIDDYWHATEREADGRPKADPAKFPHGIKYVADYLHSKGLKLGIYSCAGDKTCGKCFGGYDHEEIDAKAYAEWGVDLLKYDYCFAPWGQKDAIARYTKMGTALKSSGRSIVFSVCEWGIRKPWKWAHAAGGSYWRSTPDIVDSWAGGSPWQMSVMHILRREKGLEKYAGPGHWNDPDMLIVGNHGNGKATGKGIFKGLTQDEYRSHFALWCMLSAPLLTSCDLRSVSKEDLEIMTNPHLIAINQDELGQQASIIQKSKGVKVYSKKLKDGSVAVALFNTKNKPVPYNLKWKAIGKEANTTALDVWTNRQASGMNADGIDVAAIAPHATQIYIVR
jgi:alpha-galactosidase